MKTKDLINLISCYYDVKESGDGRYAIHNTPKGDVTYYPKSNKIQVHNGNQWIPNAQIWTIENLNILELNREEIAK